MSSLRHCPEISQEGLRKPQNIYSCWSPNRDVNFDITKSESGMLTWRVPWELVVLQDVKNATTVMAKLQEDRLSKLGGEYKGVGTPTLPSVFPNTNPGMKGNCSVDDAKLPNDLLGQTSYHNNVHKQIC